MEILRNLLFTISHDRCAVPLFQDSVKIIFSRQKGAKIRSEQQNKETTRPIQSIEQTIRKKEKAVLPGNKIYKKSRADPSSFIDRIRFPPPNRSRPSTAPRNVTLEMSGTMKEIPIPSSPLFYPLRIAFGEGISSFIVFSFFF